MQTKECFKKCQPFLRKFYESHRNWHKSKMYNVSQWVNCMAQNLKVANGTTWEKHVLNKPYSDK